MSQHNGNGNGSANRTQMLSAQRSEIDRLDAELLKLLNRRAAIACELGAIKVAAGLPAYDARREREVLTRIRAANAGPLPPHSVTRIFRRIILESRRIGKWSMQQERDRYRNRQRAIAKGNSNGY